MTSGDFLSIFALLIFLWRMKPWKTWAISDSTRECPLVSIIIPCRNEEARLPTTLESILKLKYPNFEVIVVDDSSTDNTSEIAKSLGVRVLNLDSKPSGWSGKNWACWKGAQISHGKLLLFTDADTLHASHSLTTATDYLLKSGSSLISAPPYHLCKVWYEKFLGLFFLMPLIATNFLGKPRQNRVYAIGQYLFFRRDDYFQLGGHEKLASSLAEDIDFAQLYLLNKKVFNIFPGQPIHSVQMFPDASSFKLGWIRLMRLGMKRSHWTSFIDVALMMQLFLSIFWEMTLIHALITTVAYICLGIFVKKYVACPRWTALFAPLSLLIFALLSAAARVEEHWGSQIQWRERSYERA